MRELLLVTLIALYILLLEAKVLARAYNKSNDKDTLLGVDADNDGIRDDIAKWIESNFIDKNQKQAMTQIAKAHQENIRVKDNIEASIQTSKKILRASECLDYILNENLSEANKIEKNFEAQFYNTKERLQAEQQINGNFNGQNIDVKMIADKYSCDFTIE